MAEGRKNESMRMRAILELAKNTVLAVANYFGWAKKRQELKNSVEMQQRAEAQKQEDVAARIDKEIAENDLEALRKEVSE